jgi:hypothetical protein
VGARLISSYNPEAKESNVRSLANANSKIGADKIEPRAAPGRTSTVDFFEALGRVHEAGLPIKVTASIFWEGGCRVQLQQIDCDECLGRDFADLHDAGAWLLAIVQERAQISGNQT